MVRWSCFSASVDSNASCSSLRSPKLFSLSRRCRAELLPHGLLALMSWLLSCFLLPLVLMLFLSYFRLCRACVRQPSKTCTSIVFHFRFSRGGFEPRCVNSDLLDTFQPCVLELSYGFEFATSSSESFCSTW